MRIEDKANYILAYSKAIGPLIPSDIMAQAKEIVKNHQNPNIPEKFQPVCFARLLIVDDDENLANSFKGFAEIFGHQTEVTYDAESAINLVRAGEYDQVMCDGLEGDWARVYDEAKKKGTPFVVVSGDFMVGREAESEGVRFISKTGRNSIDELKDLFTNLPTSPKQ